MSDIINANIKKEKEIIRELIKLDAALEQVKEQEQDLLKESMKSLFSQLKIISNSISEMLVQEKKKKPIKKSQYMRVPTPSGDVFIDKKSKQDFMKQIGLEQNALGKIKKKIKNKIENSPEFKKPGGFVVFASRIFHPLSSSLLKSGSFSNLKNNLKKANISYLASSYLSLCFLITFIILILSLAIAAGFGTETTIIRNIFIAVIFTIVVFIFVTKYPTFVSSNIRTRIEDELPFAVSQMSATASSKVEPSKIFPIMAKVKDYPYFANEIKKVVNQMSIYGYDFTTALKNIAKNSPSEKIAELFNGIATTTKTGGSLEKYLKEKSKDLLADYRLRRRKYSELVGMLSDVYTALLIAAPLVLMLVLTIMSVVGQSIAGLSVTSLATIGVIAIIALNIVFLIFIHITQPKT